MSRPPKISIKLLKTAALTVGVAAMTLLVTHPQLGLESESVVAQSEPQKPNVVVIMADDMSVVDLRAARQKGWMPNLETHLRNRGTEFTRSYVSLSWCCPSRATFLTGQYPHNHRVLDLDPPDGGATRLKDTSTLATWLKREGYRTGLVGKYLNGYGLNKVADDLSDDPTYIPPGWDDWQAITKQGYYNFTINDNGKLVKHGGAPEYYQTDVMRSRSVNFINESEKLSEQAPFFLFVAPFAPHLKAIPAPRHQGTASSLPLPKPPSFNEQDVSDKPAFLRKNPQLSSEQIATLSDDYRRKIETLRAVDDLIGRVVSTLKTNGELDNTVLIFTSDNGYLFGEHRLVGKTHVYEGSIRVPLFIRAPGFPQQKVSQFALNNDLAPTIADFAGAAPNIPVDGRSLIPLLRDPNRSDWRKLFLVELYQVGNAGDRGYFAVRTSPKNTANPNRLYVKYSTGDQEFYNLKTDPYQLQSLHNEADRQQQMQFLQNRLTNLKVCSGESCRVIEGN